MSLGWNHHNIVQEGTLQAANPTIVSSYTNATKVLQNSHKLLRCWRRVNFFQKPSSGLVQRRMKRPIFSARRVELKVNSHIRTFKTKNSIAFGSHVGGAIQAQVAR